jgi:hypothetical protein
MLVDRGHAWKGTNGVASRSQWRVVGENTHFDGRTRPWGLWQARRTRRGGKGGICGMLVMGEKEEIERLKFEASQERSRASMKGAEVIHSTSEAADTCVCPACRALIRPMGKFRETFAILLCVVWCGFK